MPKAESARSPSDSEVTMTELILPPHTNALGTAFGGVVLSWIDIAAATAAQRHSRKIAVTASLDAVHFVAPIRLADIVVLKASVNFTGKTSMEVGVRVEAEDFRTGEVRHAATAYLTFVTIDEKGVPVKVPPIVPRTADEKRRFKAAEIRKGARLSTFHEIRQKAPR